MVSQPSSGGAPAVDGKTPLEIRREDLTIDCAFPDEPEEDARLVCKFEALYLVQNPTSVPQEISGAFLGHDLENVRTSVDGKPIDHRLNAKEDKAIDPATRERRVEPERYGFKLSVPARKRVTMKTTGAMRPGPNFARGYTFGWPGYWRHPFFSGVWTVRFEDRHYDVRYLLDPLETWGKAGPIKGRIRWDDALEMESKALAGLPSLAIDEDTGWGSDGVTFTTRAAKTRELDLRLKERATAFHPGGPMVAVGRMFNAPYDERKILRAGWGWGVHSVIMQSLSVETNGDDYRALVPMIAQTNLLFLGVGVGLPVQFTPVRQQAVRAEFTVSVPAVAITYQIDWLRDTPAAPARTRTGVALQVSL